MPTWPAFARSLGWSLVVVSTICASAHAAGGSAKKEVDPKAQKVIDAFGKYFSGIQNFSFTANVAISVEQQGQRQNMDFVQKFSAARPNKLSCTLESPQSGASITSDGKELSVYFKAFDKYAVEEAPATFDAILQNQIVLGAISMGNAAVVTTAVLSSDPAKKLLEKAELA